MSVLSVPPDSSVPPTTLVTTTTQAGGGGDANQHFWGTAIVGGAALLLFAVVYIIVRFKGTGVLSVTFARTYALIAVVALGVLLAFSNAANDAKIAAFTLLGTVAGFLAGVKNTSTTTTTPAEGGAAGGGGAAPVGLQPIPAPGAGPVVVETVDGL
jgi:hypothetical protein